MRFLKKVIRKLYHLIYFLCLLLVFIPFVNASSVSVTYPNLYTTAGNLSSGIQCNSTFCVNYSVPVRFNTNFVTQWVANTSKTCSTQTSISGHINVQGSGELSITPDWYADNLLRVYANTNNVDYTCTYNTPSGGHIYYTCLLPSLSSSFSVSYQFRERTSSSTYINTTSIAYKDIEVNCSSDSNENITYSTDRIINSQNSNTDRIINDNRNENDKTREKIDENTEAINGLDDSINDDNVDGANSKVDDLLNDSNFNDSSGIQSIINAPLNFINGLTNTCSPINLTIPYIDEPVQIPCIKQELTNHVPLIVPVLSTAINGFIIYRILLDIVRIIKNSRNPDDDRIEVLDL